MATRTSSQSGKTHSSPFAFGSAVNDDDFLVLAPGHDVTIDADVILAVPTPPAGVTASGINPTGGGSVGGSLPVPSSPGIYWLYVTNVDGDGNESGSMTFLNDTYILISAGNIPRITVPALPSGIVSCNIYLDSLDGNGPRRYATGVTTTHDCESASYENDTVARASAAAFSSKLAIHVDQTATLTIAAGVTVMVRSDCRNMKQTVTLKAGAKLRFDTSTYSSPSTRKLSWANGYLHFVPTGDYGNLVCEGEVDNRCEISSTVGSGRACFERWVDGNYGAMLGITPMGTYTDIIRIGEATRKAFIGVASSETMDWNGFIFDDCGYVDTSAGTYHLYNFTFKNSHPYAIGGDTTAIFSCSPTNAADPADKLWKRGVFDYAPIVHGEGASYEDCIFNRRWTAGTSTHKWDHMSGCLYRFGTNGLSNVTGDSEDCWCLVESQANVDSRIIDNEEASGTITGVSGQVITDNTKSWTTNQFAPGGSPQYLIQIWRGDGTDICQIRGLNANTATTVTGVVTWDWMPQVGDSYKIFFGSNNPHGGVCQDGCTSIGNVHEATHVHEDGDGCFQYLPGTVARNCIVLPNPGKLGCGNLIASSSTGTCVHEHNTFFTVGGESENNPESHSGAIPYFRSNITWAISESGTLLAKLHCDIITGTRHNDWVTVADYNCGWNLEAGTGGGYGYSFPFTSGVPDSHGFYNTQDPSFVDCWRNIATWARDVLGHTGTIVERQSSAQDALLAINDPTDPDYDANATVANYLAYIREGFTPTNEALRGAGHDGFAMGAVDMGEAGGGGTGGGTGVEIKMRLLGLI